MTIETAGLTFSTMSKPITFTDVRAQLAACMESEVPDAVLAVLKAENGKQLTKRLLAKLPGGEDVWSISTIANMTSLVNATYRNSQGSARGGISLLMAYAVKNVMIDAQWVEDKNAGYFEARKRRNEERARAMRDDALTVRMQDAVNAVLAARETLATAEKQLDALTSYPDGPFEADRYTWAKVAGEPERTR